MVKRKSPLSLVQALLPPNQEVMGEQDHRHMMVPPAPESKFVSGPCPVPLCIRQNTSRWGSRIPLTRTNVASGVSRGALRRLKLPLRFLCRPTDFPSDHDPDLRTWQAIKRENGTHHEKIGDQRTFVSLQQAKAAPSRGGPLFRQLLHFHFGWGVRMQALSAGRRPFAGGNLRPDPTTRTRSLCLPVHFQERPDLRIAWNLSQIP